MKSVVVSGSFDDLRSRHVRFLERAANLGVLHVLLWSDADVRRISGKDPKFPEGERRYLLEAIRFVNHVALSRAGVNPDAVPSLPGVAPALWVVDEAADDPRKRAAAAEAGIAYRALKAAGLSGFTAPTSRIRPARPGRKKVIVTGCFDWFHSGHVRFFEECAGLGDLYVIVGHDANLRMLKGEGHPLFPETERRYQVSCVRHVHQALISSGHGWMDAAPEIARLKPDIYAVNEDGDKPEKREFCAAHGLRYVVLKRAPAAGLPPRNSTHLRGF